MPDIEFISRKELDEVLTCCNLIHYEDLIALDIKISKSRAEIEYFWREEKISFKQAGDLIDYYYVTGKMPENCAEASEFIKKYYAET